MVSDSRLSELCTCARSPMKGRRSPSICDFAYRSRPVVSRPKAKQGRRLPRQYHVLSDEEAEDAEDADEEVDEDAHSVITISSDSDEQPAEPEIPANAVEATLPIEQRLRWLANGTLASLSNQPETAQKVFKAAINKALPQQLMMVETNGAFPEANEDEDFDDSDVARAIGTECILQVIAPPAPGRRDTFQLFRQRVMHEDNAGILEACAMLIYPRRSQFWNKIATLVPPLIEDAYLKEYTQPGRDQAGNAIPRDPARIAEAVRACLLHDRFLQAGRLQPGVGHRLTFKVDEDAEGLMHTNPIIAEYIARSYFGKVPGGHTFKLSDWPDASWEDAKVGDKEVPTVMLAFAAAMLEFGLRSWATGEYNRIDLRNPNVVVAYRRHLAGLAATKAQAPEMLAALQAWTYKKAKSWSPRAGVQAAAAAPALTGNMAFFTQDLA
ncbi:unnamed protein product [Peniophora sp. CBMAI 1063]|nr:unnamed protein product [Peniophora sp. CBMAI 1063]